MDGVLEEKRSSQAGKESMGKRIAMLTIFWK
jgi:hypothetical protein